MDENTSNNASAQTPAASAEPQNGGLGPMIGAAIILGLIIVGGVYFYGLQLQNERQEEALPLILGDEPALIPPPANDEATIEAEIEATDLAELEAQIEADLEALEGAL